MKPGHTLLPLAATLLALGLSACQPDTGNPQTAATTQPANDPSQPLVQINRPDHSPVLAKVNGQPISQALLDAYAVERGLKLKSKADYERALNNVIDLLVMADAGRQQDLHNKLRFQQRLAIKENTLLSNELITVWVKQHPISDEEIQQEYQRQVQLAGTHQYHLHHILVPTAEEAQQVMDQLKAGRDFLAIVQDYKQVQGSEAGDLGWVDKAQLPAPLADTVAEMKKGETSPEPVQSQYGWHVLYVEDVRDRPAPPLEKVKEGIRKALYRKQVEAYMEELKKGMQIERLAEPKTGPMP